LSATPSHVEKLLARVRREGPVLALPDGALGLFDPALAVKVDAANAAELRVSGSARDLLGVRKRRRGVKWREIRALLAEQGRALSAPHHLAALHQRMRDAMIQACGVEQDLTWLAERTMALPLLPTILGGLPERARRALVADQQMKFGRLLDPNARVPLLRRLAEFKIEVAAGRTVLRFLRRRLRGADPPCDDFAAPILTLVDRISVGRASYLVTTLLTAISGAPSAVAACLWLELVRRPDWRERLRAELRAAPPEALYTAGGRALPLTIRFIRETMRLWSFPLMTRRIVDRPLEIEGLALEEGSTVEFSSYVMHHHEDHWPDPERFDPDRWIEAKPGACPAYVPFGFAPRSCVGGSLGQAQLILFCALVVGEFEVALAPGHDPRIGLVGIAAPAGFVGTLRPAEGAARPPPPRDRRSRPSDASSTGSRPRAKAIAAGPHRRHARSARRPAPS
jgi:cytochrome P450